MAAFTVRDPANRAAFDAQWARILADPSITVRTIAVDDQIAGHIVRHHAWGEPEISYWLGRSFWGHGYATAALRAFVATMSARPLFARVAHDNVASRRVLEKAGFAVIGRDTGYANARAAEIEELILRLD